MAGVLTLLLLAAWALGGGGSADTAALDAPASAGGAESASLAGGDADLLEDAGATDSLAFSLASPGKRARAAAQARQDGTSAVPTEPSLISTGAVALRADDVEAARFEAQKVADAYGGQVTDQTTRTDRDGSVRTARLVLRVPAADFDAAVSDLEGIGELDSSRTTSEDVTTQVVDTATRIRVQRESIRRIETLLSRAQRIGAVIAIEAQLTRRQADLESLLRQQAYLADQTSMSTITVNINRTDVAPLPKPQEKADQGFLAGLERGWDRLTAGALVLATALGVALPFLVLLLLVGLPTWAVARVWLRRRRPVATPA